MNADTMQWQAKQAASEYIEKESQYRMGFVDAEKPPLTRYLSQTYARSMEEGIRLLLEVDRQMAQRAAETLEGADYTATRTCVFDRGDLPLLQLDAQQKQAVQNAQVLMVDGNELEAAVEAATLAKSCAAKVLYDCGAQM